jgi:type I restriction enzyme M protein
MNNGSLFKLPDLEYRKTLVDNGYIETVISLPDRLFANTGIPITLLILSRNNKNIKFINAKNMTVKKISHSLINELDVVNILNEYKTLSNTDNTKILSLNEVANNNYSLYLQNYMDIENIDIKNPKKLKDVCIDIYRGYQVSSSEINQFSARPAGKDGYKIVNITNINEGEIDKGLTIIYPDNEKMDKYILNDKDLLVSSKGTLSKFAIAEINNNEKYIPSGNFTILRLNTELINPYYLKMFFESNKGTAVINSIKSGGVLPAINLSQFKEINVPVPSLEEQKRIVNKYLAKNDEIKILKNKLKKLEDNLIDIANEEF